MVSMDMKPEIGGFFEFPSFDCRNPSESAYHYLVSHHSGHQFVRDGRQALRAILIHLRRSGFRRAHVPAYLCSSILQAFHELPLEIRFYGHSPPLAPHLPEPDARSMVFLLDHFGHPCCDDDMVTRMADNGVPVILDVTHSVLDRKRFAMQHENLYFFASLRKVYPVPDGAIILHDRPSFPVPKEFPSGFSSMVEAMVLKKAYLEQCRKGVPGPEWIKEGFLHRYLEYEKGKENSPPPYQTIPALSLMILRNLTHSVIVRRRSRNLTYLAKNLPEAIEPLFPRDALMSPFFFPVKFKDMARRDEVQTRLIDHRVYPPVHWELPRMIPASFEYEHRLSRSILSLPIDQRYSPHDMERILKILNKEIL